MEFSDLSISIWFLWRLGEALCRQLKGRKLRCLHIFVLQPTQNCTRAEFSREVFCAQHTELTMKTQGKILIDVYNQDAFMNSCSLVE
jgi:hypothetical protein